MEVIEISIEEILEMIRRSEELERGIEGKMYVIERIRVMEGVIEEYREKERIIANATVEMEKKNLKRSEEIRENQNSILEILEKELIVAKEEGMYHIEILRECEAYSLQNTKSKCLTLKSSELRKLLDDKIHENFNIKDDYARIEKLNITITEDLAKNAKLVDELTIAVVNKEILLKELNDENEGYLIRYNEELERYKQIVTPIYQEPNFSELFQRKDEAQRKLTAELNSFPIRENNKPNEVKSVCESVHSLSTERSDYNDDNDDKAQEYKIKQRSLENCLGKAKHDIKIYEPYLANSTQNPIQSSLTSVRKQIQYTVAGLLLAVAAIYIKRIIII